MKNSTLILLFNSILLVSCFSNKSENYSAKCVSLYFDNEIKEGDWIQIDDMYFEHKDLMKFTTDPKWSTMDSSEAVRQIIAFDSMFYLPTTKFELFHKGFNEWKQGDNLPNKMGYDIFTILAKRIKSKYGNDENQIPYEFKTGAYLLVKGLIIFRRKDGQNVKIRTSQNYGAKISKLECESYFNTQ